MSWPGQIAVANLPLYSEEEACGNCNPKAVTADRLVGSQSPSATCKILGLVSLQVPTLHSGQQHSSTMCVAT